MEIELPELFNGSPEKLIPVLTDINKYKVIMLYGGRGGGKTEFITRALAYWADQKNLKICCGRETQQTIEDSVHGTLARVISQHSLNFKVHKSYIEHNATGSRMIFKGFKEQGRANIKGLDNIDILWVDEAEQITGETLKIITPTIRKDNAIMIFTMNRKHRGDAVYNRFVNDPDCLAIKINYYDNPSCPELLINEADKCKERDEKEYDHIWGGEPYEQTDDYLFNTTKLDQMLTNKPSGTVMRPQKVIGFDYALQGNDLCAACVLDRLSPTHWRVSDLITWNEPDPDRAQGRILSIIAQYTPDLSSIDKGGMGYIAFANLVKLGLPVYSFDGAERPVDEIVYHNTRAEGYYTLKQWVDRGYLILDPKFKVLINQLENIRFTYSRSTGRRLIVPKSEFKKDNGHSPDEADALMIAVYAAVHYLGKTEQTDVASKNTIKRINKSSRHTSSPPSFNKINKVNKRKW